MATTRLSTLSNFPIKYSFLAFLSNAAHGQFIPYFFLYTLEYYGKNYSSLLVVSVSLGSRYKALAKQNLGLLTHQSPISNFSFWLSPRCV